MTIEVGKAELGQNTQAEDDKAMMDELRRQRALRKASSRLANLHPYEWKILLEAALKEEGLTS